MRRLLPFVLVVAGCSGGDDDPPRDPVSAWSITHYDYAFDMRTGEATSTLTVDASGAGHCLAIPFGLDDADGVTIDGDGAHATVDEGVLTACGRKLDDEVVVLEASFTVPDDTLSITDVGFSRFDDADGNEQSYLASWVGECDRIGPCDPTPSKFATYRFSIAHDPAQQVLCSGVITTPEPDLTVCDFAFDGGPTYSTFGAIAGQWDATSLGTWAGVDVTIYDLPATGIAAAIQTSNLRGFFEWMDGTFGAYPYGTELRFVTANTFWNGFEHPGNIVLRDGMVGSPTAYADLLTHVPLHEIAHQWAGDQTTVVSVHDFVLKEAMAEYLTFVYEDEHFTPGIARTTAAAWKGYSRGADFYPVPEEGTELIDFWNDVYGPGVMVMFRQIEVMFGRDDVLGALVDLLGEQRAITVVELRDALESRTGASLVEYFDAWVFGSGAPAWPEAVVGYTDAGAGTVDVTATLSTADGVPRGCAFTVQLVGTSGNAYDVRFDFGVNGAAVAPQNVTPGFDVTGTILDPYRECLVFLPGEAFGAPRPQPWQ